MKNTFFFIALLLSTQLFSQCPNDTDTTKRIKVVGNAEVTLNVSSFILDISLKELFVQPRNYSGAPVLDEPIDSLEKKLLALIDELGLGQKNLKFISIFTMPNNMGNYEPNLLTSIYEFKIEKTVDVNRFLRSANFRGISATRVRRQFDVDDDQVRAKLSTQALKNAKQKADELLSSVNKRTGDILTIDMNGYSNQMIIDDPNLENWNGYSNYVQQIQPKTIPMSLIVTYNIVD